MVLYMTFGAGQMLQGYQIGVVGKDRGEIQRAIFRNFGITYSSLYDSPTRYEKLLCMIDLANCNVPDEFYNPIAIVKKEEED